VLVQANQERTLRALRKLDFLMVLDIFPTATTEAADLVLPVAADLEAVDYRAYSSSRGGFVALREKVVEPPGKARSVFEIEYLLAERMGLNRDYPFRGAEEWLDFVLKPSGVTLEGLRQSSIVYASPPVDYRKYGKGGFSTSSGKIECYSPRFGRAGYPALPTFQDPAESPLTDPALAKRFSLIGTTKRPAGFVHTKLRNIPVLEKRHPDPHLMVHPADAEKRGIRQNDSVEVESARGSLQVKACITDEVGPGLVAVDFGWGNPSDKKANVNALTSDGVWDPVSGGYPNRLFLCEVRGLDSRS